MAFRTGTSVGARLAYGPRLSSAAAEAPPESRKRGEGAEGVAEVEGVEEEGAQGAWEKVKETERRKVWVKA